MDGLHCTWLTVKIMYDSSRLVTCLEAFPWWKSVGSIVSAHAASTLFAFAHSYSKACLTADKMFVKYHIQNRLWLTSVFCRIKKYVSAYLHRFVAWEISSLSVLSRVLFWLFLFSGSMNPNTPFALSFRCRSHVACEKFEMCHSKL